MSDLHNPVVKDAEPQPDLQRRLRQSRRLNIVLAAIAAFLLVVVISQQAGRPSLQAAPEAVKPTASATGKSLAAQVARNQVGDPMAWGDPSAPVLMVQWTDFRCPFCAAFSRDTLPVLFSQYIDTGKVRLELHDAALFGDQSVDAAVAARAAGAQGKYHEYMTAVYAAAPAGGHPDLPKGKLIGFAQQAGVADINKFTAALSDEGLRKQVTDATAHAQQLGVNSVPFFVIGNQVVSGARPAANFQAAIESALAGK